MKPGRKADNKPKWTPGPWKAEDRSVQYGDGLWNGVVDKRGMLICLMGMQGQDQAANADLVAAAPELYDALEAILARYQKHVSITWGGEAEVARMLELQMRSALAKARGEQTDAR